MATGRHEEPRSFLAIEHGHPAGVARQVLGRVIGDCGIRAPVDDAGCVEIGYGLADPYQGQGFGTEVVMAISDWLLAQRQLLDDPCEHPAVERRQPPRFLRKLASQWWACQGTRLSTNVTALPHEAVSRIGNFDEMT